VVISASLFPPTRSGRPIDQESEKEDREQENEGTDIPVATVSGGPLARGHGRSSAAGVDGKDIGQQCFMSPKIIERRDGFAALIQVSEISKMDRRPRKALE